MKSTGTLLLCVLVSGMLGCAFGDGTSEPAHVDQATQALLEGEVASGCFDAELGPQDAEECEDKSGTKIFEREECKMEVERICQLRQGPGGGFRCCCRIEVLRATDQCDAVDWQDLLGMF